MVRVSVDDDRAFAVLINETGKIADSMEQWSGRTPIFEGGANLHELFDLARASALDVNGLVDGMLENLRQGKYRKVIEKKKDDDIPF